ncbi:MAG: TlpA family protein disulfide reductase [Flavobacteriaceae bacterium]
MRNLIPFLLTLLLLSCNESPKKNTAVPVVKKEVVIPESLLGKDLEGNEILVGKVSFAQMAHYCKEWYSPDYNRYKVNVGLLEQIKPLLKGKEVTLLMGTWCEDSQREVPGMMKILAEAGYAIAQMEIIAVDEDKRTPSGVEQAYEASYVPALIVYENGEEINRIVEFPLGTLEEDLLAILSGEDYKHAYAE